MFNSYCHMCYCHMCHMFKLSLCQRHIIIRHIGHTPIKRCSTGNTQLTNSLTITKNNKIDAFSNMFHIHIQQVCSIYHACFKDLRTTSIYTQLDNIIISKVVAKYINYIVLLNAVRVGIKAPEPYSVQLFFSKSAMIQY